MCLHVRDAIKKYLKLRKHTFNNIHKFVQSRHFRKYVCQMPGGRPRVRKRPDPGPRKNCKCRTAGMDNGCPGDMSTAIQAYTKLFTLFFFCFYKNICFLAEGEQYYFLPILGGQYTCKHSQIIAYYISLLYLLWGLDGVKVISLKLACRQPDMTQMTLLAEMCCQVCVAFWLVLPFRERKRIMIL